MQSQSTNSFVTPSLHQLISEILRLRDKQHTACQNRQIGGAKQEKSFMLEFDLFAKGLETPLGSPAHEGSASIIISEIRSCSVGSSRGIDPIEKDHPYFKAPPAPDGEPLASQASISSSLPCSFSQGCAEAPRPRTETLHCGRCRKLFGSRNAARAHHKMNVCRNSQMPPCLAEHEHEPLRLQFDTMDEALNWRVESQYDRYFSFKGTKNTKGIQAAYRVLSCNQNIREKKAGTTKSKKAFLCLAKITFNQTKVFCCPTHPSDVCLNAKEQVLVYGCLAHSHPIERKNIRLSKLVKTRTAELLTSGILPEVVIEKYLSTNDSDPASKPLTYDDVYRIKKSLTNKGYDGNASEVKNVSNLLTGPVLQGFNFGKQLDISSMPEDIVEKVTDTSGYFLLTSNQLFHFKYFQECDKIDQKTRDVRKVLRSADYSIKEKRKMMEAFRKPFASVINTSPPLNPLTFPKLDRKRVHEPQNRSFFPRKFSKPNPKS